MPSDLWLSPKHRAIDHPEPWSPDAKIDLYDARVRWKDDETRRLRAESHAIAYARAADTPAEIPKTRSGRRDNLPRGNDAAVEAMTRGLRKRGGTVAPSTIALFKEMSADDLGAEVEDALPGDVQDTLNAEAAVLVLRGRAETDANAAAVPATLRVRLKALVSALPDVQRSQEEYDRLGVLESRIRSSLNAISTGEPDEGARDEQIAAISARIRSGEITKDEGRDALKRVG